MPAGVSVFFSIRACSSPWLPGPPHHDREKKGEGSRRVAALQRGCCQRGIDGVLLLLEQEETERKETERKQKKRGVRRGTERNCQVLIRHPHLRRPTRTVQYRYKPKLRRETEHFFKQSRVGESTYRFKAIEPRPSDVFSDALPSGNLRVPVSLSVVPGTCISKLCMGTGSRRHAYRPSLLPW